MLALKESRGVCLFNHEWLHGCLYTWRIKKPEFVVNVVTWRNVRVQPCQSQTRRTSLSVGTILLIEHFDLRRKCLKLFPICNITFDYLFFSKHRSKFSRTKPWFYSHRSFKPISIFIKWQNFRKSSRNKSCFKSYIRPIRRP